GTLRLTRFDGTRWNEELIDGGPGVGSAGSLAFDGAGNPAVAYYNLLNRDLEFARKSGGAWRIEPVDTAGSVGNPSSLRLDGAGLALDAAGRPALAWIDATSKRIKDARRYGTAWAIEVVAAPGRDRTRLALALDPTGRAAIAYGALACQDFDLDTLRLAIECD